jgi:hypothetical protein
MLLFICYKLGRTKMKNFMGVMEEMQILWQGESQFLKVLWKVDIKIYLNTENESEKTGHNEKIKSVQFLTLWVLDNDKKKRLAFP